MLMGKTQESDVLESDSITEPHTNIQQWPAENAGEKKLVRESCGAAPADWSSEVGVQMGVNPEAKTAEEDEDEQEQEVVEEVEKGNNNNNNATGDGKPVYTIFRNWERYAITGIASFMSLYSSISVPIYLPALTDIEHEFHVTTEQINLTVVTYSIFQGLAPAIWSPAADHIGRRPVYIICVIVYICACVGLALAPSYGVLLGMRALQAAGMATTVALGAGVVGDLTTRADRGSFMGIFSGFTLVGSAVGPLIGAGLTSSFDWRAIFWFLVIAAGASFVLLVLILPETARFIVGNGLVKPQHPWNQAPSMILRGKLIPSQKQIPFEQGAQFALLVPPKKTSILRTFRIVCYKDVALTLAPIGLHYTLWFMIITAQSTLLQSEYNFTVLQVGISYLANGIGSILGSLVSGRIMNKLYQKDVRKFKQSWLEEHGPDIPPNMHEFDIQKARLKPAQVVSILVLGTSIIFGWTIEYKVHWIVPILMTFFISWGCVFYINLGTCLMVDLFPEEGSSASAALNVVRCLLCAAGLAAVDRMTDSLGTGGAFTLMSGLVFLSWICIFLEMKNGHRWDRERRAREKKPATGPNS